MFDKPENVIPRVREVLGATAIGAVIILGGLVVVTAIAGVCARILEHIL